MHNIIQKAQEAYERDRDHWESCVYQKAREDLHFLSDDPYAQWDPGDYQARCETGRPAITIDQLGQFVHQVSNDVRMNTPTIHVIPADLDSDPKTAEIFKGLIRNIEYASNADDAYDLAVTNAIKCSIGFLRIDHMYQDGEAVYQKGKKDNHNNESRNQVLCIKRVINPFSVYLDCASVEIDGRDAKHATLIESLSAEEFQRRYPEKDPVSFDSSFVSTNEARQSYTHGRILIAEHYKVSYEGDCDQKTSLNKNASKYPKARIKRYVLSGKDVLEETIFPGRYIPLIPVYGEEAWEDGKRNIQSLIRKSKQAQRMYNFWKSLETELLMKQPQAPVLAAEGQVEDYAADWKDPAKSMVLRYKTTDIYGNPVPPPQRLMPPQIPIGVVNAAAQSADDIKATMGLYQSSLGQVSNEISGIAIHQRKLEGDVATYHFGDNLVKSITHAGRILVGAIPTVYDTPRIIRILDSEEQTQSVGINGLRVEGQEDHYDIRSGHYDVKVTTGAPFTSRRQEAAKFFSDLVRSQPQLMQVMGDLLFKHSDFTGADIMEARMKKVIDPKFLGDQEQDPEKESLRQELDAHKAMLEELSQRLKSKETKEALEHAIDQAKVQADIEKIRTDAKLRAQELSLKSREIRLKEALN